MSGLIFFIWHHTAKTHQKTTTQGKVAVLLTLFG